MVKNLPANTEDTRDAVGSLGREDSLEKEMATHSSIPVFLPRKFHRQRRLAGYSPWGHRQWDTTEQLSTFKKNKAFFQATWKMSVGTKSNRPFYKIRRGSYLGKLAKKSSLHTTKTLDWASRLQMRPSRHLH